MRRYSIIVNTCKCLPHECYALSKVQFLFNFCLCNGFGVLVLFRIEFSRVVYVLLDFKPCVTCLQASRQGRHEGFVRRVHPFDQRSDLVDLLPEHLCPCLRRCTIEILPAARRLNASLE